MSSAIRSTTSLHAVSALGASPGAIVRVKLSVEYGESWKATVHDGSLFLDAGTLDEPQRFIVHWTGQLIQRRIPLGNG